MASSKPPASRKMNWNETNAQASAATTDREFYVTRTPLGTFRYVIWDHQSPRHIISWGEQPTLDAAIDAAEHDGV